MLQLQQIRVLVIDDSSDDCALTIRELKNGGFEPKFRRVESEGPLRLALEEESWDIIICDFSMPQFSAPAAMAIVNELKVHTPLIIVSGSVAEETAAEAMRMGARDYVLKDQLTRLAPAIRRELGESEMRRQNRNISEALEKSEESIRQLSAIGNDAIWEWNIATGRLTWNEGFIEHFGYQRSEIDTSVEWSRKLIHPDDYFEVRSTLAGAAASGGKRWVREYRFKHKNGKYLDVVDHAYFIQNADGVTIRAAGAMRDITDIKRAQAEARESESQLKVAQRLAQIGSFEFYPIEGMASWSDEFFRIFGYSPETDQSSFHAYLSKIHPEDLPRVSAMIKQGILDKKAYELTYRIIPRAGEIKHVQSRCFPVSDDSGADLVKIVGTCQDVTERLKQETALQKGEEQIRQLQKMDAIGRLAGGIAHDYNNMLAAIGLYCDLAINDLQEPAKLKVHIEDIKETVERGAALTKQLLLFSRNKTTVPQVVEFDRVANQLERMLRRLVGDAVELITDYQAGSGRVEVDPGQLEQVILNLVVNARDAMPTGGRLTIATEEVVIDATQAKSLGDINPGRYILLAVGDTGIGMSEEIQLKIFEPFFTTKAMNKGTGLGLSTAYGIVKQHNGAIDVISVLGDGSVFRVYLPLVTGPAVVAETPATSSSDKVSVVASVILLVEDEDRLRGLFESVLKKHGFAVITAKNGADALEVLMKPNLKVDLCISDVMMPKMNGVELAAEIEKLERPFPVLLMSGFADDVLSSTAQVDSKEFHFLQKPFNAAALIRKVTDLLASSTQQESA